MLKEISIFNTIEENKRIFDSIKVGERFFIVFKNISIFENEPFNNYGIYKCLFVKIDKSENETRNIDYSFLHKNSSLACINIPCNVCAFSKRAGFKPIFIKNK